MAKVSSNEKGNKYHDEKTGEFTTANGGSAKQGETTTLKSEIPESLPTPKLKLKEGVDLEALRKKISERQQLGKIPYLQTSNEIENHIEEFFPEMMIRDIEKIYDFDLMKNGGHIVAQGTPAQIIENPISTTGQFLSGMSHPQPPA